MTDKRKIGMVLCVLALFVVGFSNKKTVGSSSDLDAIQSQINDLQRQIHEAQARLDKIKQKQIVTSENTTQEETEVLETVVSVVEGAVETKADEENLRDILSRATSETILEFICDDFDGNGTFEAFAVTSDDPMAEMYGDLDNMADCYNPYNDWLVTYSGANVIDKEMLGPGFVSVIEAQFSDGTKTILSNSYRSHYDTDTAVFVVIDDNYKYLGTYSSAWVSDGQLDSSTYQQGTVEGKIYDYQNGELILVKEYIDDY